MGINPSIDIIAVINLIGTFLGFLLAFFLIKKSLKKNLPNLFMGFFIFAISASMLEGWLNYTGYIFDVLWLTNFAEPFNFLIAPLIYLFLKSQLNDLNGKKWGWHLLPYIFWTFYIILFFLQPTAVKYNDNLEVMQLDLPRMLEVGTYSDDPLGIRKYTNLLTGISFLIYMFLNFRLLIERAKSLGDSIFKPANSTLLVLRNSIFHFLIVTMIFILVKVSFDNDIGDHYIYLYLSCMLLLTTYQIMNRSDYFEEVSTFLEGPVGKYKKSSLVEDGKAQILKNILFEFKEGKYFLSNTASLSGLSKVIHESPHHVSQVINEKLNQSFFELLSSYRIEEAKSILKTEIGKKVTLEEVAERVGYNSKSAFNTAFRKNTSMTPSEYRDS